MDASSSSKPAQGELPGLASNFLFEHFAGVSVGSRKPTRDPVWVTPHVVTGGFATGQAAASLGADESNASWLTTDGFFKLSAMLDTGAYEITLPEHGVLLCIVWLIRSGRESEAKTLLKDVVTPFKERLRFFPTATLHTPADVNAQHIGAMDDAPGDVNGAQFKVFLKPVADTIETLRQKADRASAPPDGHRLRVVHGYKRHCLHIAPLRAEAVALLSEIMPERPPANEWQQRAAEWRKRLAEAVCQAPNGALTKRQQRGTVGRCDAFMRHVAAGTAKLSIAADILREANARDARASHQNAASRLAAVQRTEPLLGGPALAMADRLSMLVPESERQGGLHPRAVADIITAPLDLKMLRYPRAAPAPEAIVRLVQRSTVAPLVTLVEKGIVPSAEAITSFIPALHGAALAAGFTSSPLRRLLSNLSAAFRRRRSLLLLNFETQVRVEELPWYASTTAVARSMGLHNDDVAVEAARSAVAAVLAAWLVGFPGTIIPNKLVSACRELVAASKLEQALPFTPELAADIFEGGLSPNFDKAGAIAADVMRGSFYEHVFGLKDKYAAMAARPTSGNLFTHASELKGTYEGLREGGGTSSYVAANARVIEAAMILTTHNCAQAYFNPIIGPRVRSLVGVSPRMLATRAFTTVLSATATPTGNFHLRLLARKRAAYAFRQTVFYLSCCDTVERRTGIAQLEEIVHGKGWANGSHVVDAYLAPLSTGAEDLPPSDVVLGWYKWDLPVIRRRSVAAV